jgi:hypothetical protein
MTHQDIIEYLFFWENLNENEQKYLCYIKRNAI